MKKEQVVASVSKKDLTMKIVRLKNWQYQIKIHLGHELIDKTKTHNLADIWRLYQILRTEYGLNRLMMTH